MPSLTAKEEIVLCFYKEDELVAIERKNGGDKLHRYTVSESTWADTIDLFEARKSDDK